MNSNVIHLSTVLEARKDLITLTRKQQITVELRNHHREGRRLIQSIELHKAIYNRRVQKLKEVFKSIQLREEELLKL